MNEAVGDVFADTFFWIALVVKQDEHHQNAQAWSRRIGGKIVTTRAVLLETAGALSRPAWRQAAIALIARLEDRDDVDIVPLSDELWSRAWTLYGNRHDKAWSMTDCISFTVMQDRGLADALTGDAHFAQAGFRVLLRDDVV